MWTLKINNLQPILKQFPYLKRHKTYTPKIPSTRIHQIRFKHKEISPQINCKNPEIINKTSINPRTEQIFKITCNISNTDTILSNQEIQKVRLPNTIVKINGKRELLTSLINANVIQRTIHFRNIKLEPIQNFLANNFNNQETKETEIDRNTEILNQLRLDCLNNKKKFYYTTLPQFSHIPILLR